MVMFTGKEAEEKIDLMIEAVRAFQDAMNAGGEPIEVLRQKLQHADESLAKVGDFIRDAEPPRHDDEQHEAWANAITEISKLRGQVRDLGREADIILGRGNDDRPN